MYLAYIMIIDLSGKYLILRPRK